MINNNGEPISDKEVRERYGDAFFEVLHKSEQEKEKERNRQKKIEDEKSDRQIKYVKDHAAIDVIVRNMRTEYKNKLDEAKKKIDIELEQDFKNAMSEKSGISTYSDISRILNILKASVINSDIKYLNRDVDNVIRQCYKITDDYDPFLIRELYRDMEEREKYGNVIDKFS